MTGPLRSSSRLCIWNLSCTASTQTRRFIVQKLKTVSDFGRASPPRMPGEGSWWHSLSAGPGEFEHEGFSHTLIETFFAAHWQIMLVLIFDAEVHIDARLWSQWISRTVQFGERERLGHHILSYLIQLLDMCAPHSFATTVSAQVCPAGLKLVLWPFHLRHPATLPCSLPRGCWSLCGISAAEVRPAPRATLGIVWVLSGGEGPAG